MAIEAGTFEVMIPSRYITFTLPNLLLPNFSSYLHADRLRVAVLDSPSPSHDAAATAAAPPRIVAAMLVPKGREDDWIFTTEEGQTQLMSSEPSISRLVLIGNEPRDEDGCGFGKGYRKWLDDDDLCYVDRLEASLLPLMACFWPKRDVGLGVVCDVSFLRYEDNVVGSVVLERCKGSRVGEMLVEDVEIDGVGTGREFRRRLRFRRMPNWVQSEVRIVPDVWDGVAIGEVEFRLDLGVLVHPYLAPMVAGLALIGGDVYEKFRAGMRPRALCAGVGGGALLTYLANQCGFEVFGVEIDEVVLSIARQYFGLGSSELVHCCLGDVVEILKKLDFHGTEPGSMSMVAREVANGSSMDAIANFSCEFDVIMVDLDSHDCARGMSAPPLEFTQKDVLVAAKLSLSKTGILILNVIPPNKSFYEDLFSALRGTFEELYEIDAGNGENYVVIATRSLLPPTSRDSENSFVRKLKLGAPGAFMDSIRKI